MTRNDRRLAILAEGSFTPLDAKTATGVLRYRPRDVAAVIDSTRAGRRASECVGVGGDVPVVDGVEAAAAAGANALMIGIAPQGGGLPAAWRATIAAALARGWDVWSGLHAFLADDPEFAALAARHGGALHDVRRPPAGRAVSAMRAAATPALVVLTVGTDCNVGKMTTALEVQRALEARGVRAAFVATGQTGIFIAGGGAAVDAVPSDFVGGVVEALVVEAARDADVVLVEGQGALHHPGYAPVTLGLVHGACPDAMILCHDASRTHLHAGEAVAPVPALEEARAAYETAASWVHPSAVIGVAVNTARLGDDEARTAVARAAAALDLPAADPIRFSPAPLAEAVARRLAMRARAASTDPEASCA